MRAITVHCLQIRRAVILDQFKTTAAETLEELEWCLERLENIQTHRSVSDMASSKFKKMLNKELSQFTDGGRNAKQISEYICSTFLDSKEVEAGSGPDGTCEAEHGYLTTPTPNDDHAGVRTGGKSVTAEQNFTYSGPEKVSSDVSGKDETDSTEDGQKSGGKPVIDAEKIIKPFGVVSNYPKQLETVRIYFTSMVWVPIKFRFLTLHRCCSHSTSVYITDYLHHMPNIYSQKVLFCLGEKDPSERRWKLIHDFNFDHIKASQSLEETNLTVTINCHALITGNNS
ncbi:unnamed protein product [Echinostoma caproni]|uniref:3',5'-cyclic-AMP phosphodiesterase n=1 Tax=Echinostoma caproni TaxID=27848 RepID=A0A183AD80_9TREM|nr:unnamed protein product [Echinostoma caproni]